MSVVVVVGHLRSRQPWSAPSPTCGGGVGRGKARTNLRASPLPNPPPTEVGLARLAQNSAEPGQAGVPAGEGTLWPVPSHKENS
jgi:hypothetical protein